MQVRDIYKQIGCPKCGAKHKRIKGDIDLMQCYRCWFDFYPCNARKYEQDKK